MNDTKLRALQLKELEILKEFKRVCDKCNLQYYLSDGTLLGAVRHQGFIPWDDDVDVMMPYKDYLRFLELAKDELDERFFIQNYMTDVHDHQGYTKIRMNNTAMVMPNHKRWKIHQGVWMDIFPMIPVKNEKDMARRGRLLSYSNFCQMDSFILDNEEEFSGLLGMAYVPFLIFLKTPIKIRRILHSVLLRYAYRETDEADFFTVAWASMKNIYSKSLLEGEATEILFEDSKFNVLPGYEQYLIDTYGDYMELPPVEQRKGHGKLIVDLNRSYTEVVAQFC